MNEFDTIVDTINNFLDTTDKTYYRIGKDSGISRQTIKNILDGKTKVSRMRMDKARILYEYVLKQQKKDPTN